MYTIIYRFFLLTACFQALMPLNANQMQNLESRINCLVLVHRLYNNKTSGCHIFPIVFSRFCVFMWRLYRYSSFIRFSFYEQYRSFGSHSLFAFNNLAGFQISLNLKDNQRNSANSEPKPIFRNIGCTTLCIVKLM